MRLSDHLIARALFAFAFFGLGFVAGNCARSIAVAQVEDATPTQLAFALALARTTANEAGMLSPNDARLIYDAARSHGRDDSDRLGWLRRHSSCVNGGDCNRDGRVDERDARAADRRPGNARWTRHLAWNNTRPRSFPTGARWFPEHWQRLREFVLRLVVRDRPTRVCGVPVITWGRRSDFRARPGLVPVECNAANLGATTPSILQRVQDARREADAERLALADESS